MRSNRLYGLLILMIFFSIACVWVSAFMTLFENNSRKSTLNFCEWIWHDNNDKKRKKKLQMTNNFMRACIIIIIFLFSIINKSQGNLWCFPSVALLLPFSHNFHFQLLSIIVPRTLKDSSWIQSHNERNIIQQKKKEKSFGIKLNELW